jgi:hypothetical protein
MAKSFGGSVQGYKSTVDTTGFSDSDFRQLRIGQWVAIMGELRGQYLGITAAGVTVINYKKAPSMVRQFKANRPLRQFAKLMGSY